MPGPLSLTDPDDVGIVRTQQIACLMDHLIPALAPESACHIGRGLPIDNQTRPA